MPLAAPSVADALDVQPAAADAHAVEIHRPGPPLVSIYCGPAAADRAAAEATRPRPAAVVTMSMLGPSKSIAAAVLFVRVTASLPPYGESLHR